MDKDNFYNHVHEDGFIRYPNEIALYTILGHIPKGNKELKEYEVTSATLDVYRALFQHRNTNPEHKHFGKAWPSQRRLQIELAMSDNTLRKHITVLENVGLLIIHRLYRGNKPFHVYSFPEPMGVEEFKRTFQVQCGEFEKKMKALLSLREEEAIEEEMVDIEW
jgi:hypothetical protein